MLIKIIIYRVTSHISLKCIFNKYNFLFFNRYFNNIFISLLYNNIYNLKLCDRVTINNILLHS